MTTCPLAFGADIVDRLQAYYRSIKGYSAQFTEETMLPGSKVPQTRKGRVEILIPSRMRWDYADPDKSDMIVDGARLWLVQSKREEAIYWDFQGEAEVPLGYSFLMGVGDLRKSFEVKAEKGKDSEWVLRLKPKAPDYKDQTILLTVEDDPPSVTGLETKGQMGESIRIRFEEFAEAKDFPDQTFTYKPGPKTRVRDAREILAPPPPPAR